MKVSGTATVIDTIERSKWTNLLLTYSETTANVQYGWVAITNTDRNFPLMHLAYPGDSNPADKTVLVKGSSGVDISSCGWDDLPCSTVSYVETNLRTIGTVNTVTFEATPTLQSTHITCSLSSDLAISDSVGRAPITLDWMELDLVLQVRAHAVFHI